MIDSRKLRRRAGRTLGKESLASDEGLERGEEKFVDADGALLAQVFEEEDPEIRERDLQPCLLSTISALSPA